MATSQKDSSIKTYPYQSNELVDGLTYSIHKFISEVLESTVYLLLDAEPFLCRAK